MSMPPRAKIEPLVVWSHCPRCKSENRDEVERDTLPEVDQPFYVGPISCRCGKQYDLHFKGRLDLIRFCQFQFRNRRSNRHIAIQFPLTPPPHLG
jgi:hypothetical protein